MKTLILAVFLTVIAAPVWSGECPEGQTKLQDGACVQASPTPPQPTGGSAQVLPDVRNVPALPLPASTAAQQEAPK